MKKAARWMGIVLAIAVVIGTARACGLLTRPFDTPISESEGGEGSPPGLTLKDVTLEQPDESGELRWRVHADEVIYSPDQQTAEIINPDGELFQDGKVIYRVKADRGEIQQDGEAIFLKDNIVATGVENDLILRGQEMEWRPEDDLLLVREQITGTHPQLKASAQEARVYNRERRLELEKEVVATTNEAPYLRLEAEKLTWFIEAESVESNLPLKVEQLKGEVGDLQVSDRVKGERGEMDLSEKIVTLTQAVEVELLEQPLKILSEEAIWNVVAETILVPRTLRVIQPEQAVRVTANRGEMSLADSIIYLSQGVEAALSWD